ncbi:MAG TPA: dienelactone hydrolase family protein [Dehalococcoidia bacterium]|nr:dienelactone hydrolase family protein [Dehalococcoidia bacterium]
MGEMVTFPANGGRTSGYLSKPPSGSGRGVIVIQEWWGLNDHIKSIADRFAEEGFVALAPDMYHGKITDEPDEAGKLYMALNIEQAEKDLRGAIAFLKEMTGAPVGTVGFCMGGALSLFAACQADGDVGVCVDFYGGHEAVTYDWDNLTAPVLGIWAEDDDFVNPNVPGYEAALRERGKRYESITYPGTQHAFFNNDRPETFNPEAAADAWQRTLAFFRQHLG